MTLTPPTNAPPTRCSLPGLLLGLLPGLLPAVMAGCTSNGLHGQETAASTQATHRQAQPDHSADNARPAEHAAHDPHDPRHELQHSHREADREHGHTHDDDLSGVVGQPAPPWNLSQWFNSEPQTVQSLRGSVVLVRWFMSPECPHCSATAPSLKTFDQRYRDKGLTVVGLYHHKAEEPLEPGDVQGYIDHYGFEFPIGVDADWNTLKTWWLDGHKRAFTSVSFLLDRAGIIRYVHLGGTYREGDADFVEIDRLINQLLKEPAP